MEFSFLRRFSKVMFMLTLFFLSVLSSRSKSPLCRAVVVSYLPQIASYAAADGKRSDLAIDITLHVM